MNDLAIRAGASPGPRTGEVRPLAEDILKGADEIAVFMFGDPKKRRLIYHLSERSNLPIFRLGALLCARKSVLLAWIAEQEARATAPSDE